MSQWNTKQNVDYNGAGCELSSS